MNRWNRCVGMLLGLAIGGIALPSLAGSGVHSESSRERGSESSLHFDLPSVAPAVAIGDDANIVTVELRLSSMIDSADTPSIDQWLVRCQPRNRDLRIVDYAPRTETGSDVATPIQVKNTSEKSSAVGVGLDGAYGHLARFNAASDQAKKQTNSVQFDRLAPLHAVTASGTINRGRGVYFKLRWTAQQILEGEKTFRITMKVPAEWRGSLVDVSVVAQGQRKTLGWDRETKTIGAAGFVVAIYRENDREAEAKARDLAEAEFQLRNLADSHRVQASQGYSVTSLLRHVANRLDLDSDSKTNGDWLSRLFTDRADPHLDDEITRLPMQLRLAILEYADCRNDFVEMKRLVQPAALESIADSSRSHGH